MRRNGLRHLWLWWVLWNGNWRWCNCCNGVLLFRYPIYTNVTLMVVVRRFSGND